MNDENHSLRFRQRDPALRLRAAALWGGIVLSLSGLLPHDVIDDQLVFAWQIFPELGAAGVLAALSGSLAGVAILLAWKLLRNPMLLAEFVLVALLTVVVWTKLGSDAEAWGMLSVPDSIGQRSPLLLFSLAGASAGFGLLSSSETQRIGQRLLLLASLTMALFFAWPGRGESPGVTLFQLLLNLFSLPNLRFVLGHLLFGFLLVFPMAVGVLAAMLALRPKNSLPWFLPFVPTLGLPAFLLLLVFRSLLITLGDTSIVAFMFVAAGLLAVGELLASALQVLGATFAVSDGPEKRPGLRLLRLLSPGLVSVPLLALPQIFLARPPSKGIAWTLDPASVAADRLFGERLTTWNDARSTWEAATRRAPAAGPMVAMQAAAREMLSEARLLNQTLASSFTRLTLESRDLDLAGRRWARLVAEVNEANQQAHLPYYLDASVSLRPSADGLERDFSVVGYRILAVKPVTIDGQPFATLAVQELGASRAHHGLLGFSRDWQPFALVVSDEIENSVNQLVAQSEAAEANCSLDNDPAPLLVREMCQRILKEELQSGRESLRAVLTQMTERHELQHQVDGPHLELAPSLTRRLQGVRDEDQDRVNRELSAYLAEMAPKEAHPKLGLLWLLRFGMSGGINTYAQISALALGALSNRAVGGHTLNVDGQDVQATFSELMRLSDDALRERARLGWEELFDAPLPSVTSLPSAASQ